MNWRGWESDNASQFPKGFLLPPLLDKYIFLFGKMKFGQVHLAIWKDTIFNLWLLTMMKKKNDGRRSSIVEKKRTIAEKK